MSGNYLKQGVVNTIILSKLFQLAQTDKPEIAEAALENFFRPYIGIQRVKLAISSAYDKDFIEDVGPGAEYVYVITSAGYRVIEEMYLKEDSATRKMIDEGFEQYFEAKASSLDSTERDIPASDRMVTIGDNLPGYSEVLENVEAAQEAIRADNTITADERSWVRVHLDLGLQLLRKGGTALKSALEALLVEPLKDALKETSADQIKLILKAALQALKTFLGIG